MRKPNRFAGYAWSVLAINILVILWGAYVRATGSGAGCGSHWPLCNGEIVPRNPQLETIIEFTHRLSSGFALILVAILFIWAFRAYPKKHIVRFGASLSAIFILTEALVGAGLVLFEWVAGNASTGRVISIAIHLVNTFLLLMAITLTAWWATSGDSFSFKGKKTLAWIFGVGFIGGIMLGVSGAITALGDTLFPADSLVEGIRQDFSPTAHFILRLRIWHPILAILVGSYFIIIAGVLALYANDELKKFSQESRNEMEYEERHFRSLRFFANIVIGIVIVQLLAGLLNLLLLAPVWMQIVHLLLADLVWISFILLAANAFSRKPAIQTYAKFDEVAL
jgi:heme A synthase